MLQILQLLYVITLQFKKNSGLLITVHMIICYSELSLIDFFCLIVEFFHFNVLFTQSFVYWSLMYCYFNETKNELKTFMAFLQLTICYINEWNFSEL